MNSLVPRRPISLHETPVLQAFPEQFPTQANRENILRNREFLAGKQRILAHEALVRTHHNPGRTSFPYRCRRTAALRGGLDRSAQHSNLLAKMECGHEAATSHLLFCGSAVCDPRCPWQRGSHENTNR